jgi:hypothetical protein
VRQLSDAPPLDSNSPGSATWLAKGWQATWTTTRGRQTSQKAALTLAARVWRRRHSDVHSVERVSVGGVDGRDHGARGGVGDCGRGVHGPPSQGWERSRTATGDRMTCRPQGEAAAAAGRSATARLLRDSAPRLKDSCNAAAQQQPHPSGTWVLAGRRRRCRPARGARRRAAQCRSPGSTASRR